jgi:predicted TIM-barrel fold metal-dependent hydrolase
MKMPPADIERILRRFPRLVLVLSHCLFPYFREVRALMEGYRGVWLDATNVFGALNYLAPLAGPAAGRVWSETGELFRALMTDFSDRTLFGTDHPVGMGSLGTIYGDFAAFGLSDEVTRAILWENPLPLSVGLPRYPTEMGGLHGPIRGAKTRLVIEDAVKIDRAAGCTKTNLKKVSMK